MYRNKKDVDQHVASLMSRLSSKEFFSRGYSIGRLYYDVGDYSSCRRYVEQYITQNNNNAAAHTLLGQALQQLGEKEKALEEFKTSYGICPSQNSLVLNICEMLADDEVDLDPGRAKHWCDKAESLFPKHTVTFKLREKLMSIANPDPKALAILLTEELALRPKDVLLHIRLLKFYLKNQNIEAAYTHSCNVEFSETNFIHNFEWYKTVAQILKCNPRSDSDWLFQLLLLTVSERMCCLSLAETHSNSDTSIFEATVLLHVYDQALERVANAGFDHGYCEFHKSLLQHHRSQFAFLAATFLLKRVEDHNWSDVTRDADPLMLIAWQSPPFDPALSWVNSAPKIQQNAARRWYCEGSYRCSQSGHYLLHNISDKSQAFLDRILQNVASTLWQGKLYGRIFSSRFHLERTKSSHLLSSLFKAPALRLPKRKEVEVYDAEAQRAYGNSLHHLVWILLNYKDYSQFRCTIFEMLPLTIQNDANCGLESLCQLDVYAFLYCAALTSRQNRSCHEQHWPLNKPNMLPASITDLLCTLAQMKWWDCAYKFSRHELGSEMTDIRATLSRGIECVRCIDNHGLDPEILCKLGRIFNNRAKQVTDIDEKKSWEMRAVMYFSSAIPLLEKPRSHITSKSDKRMFNYVSDKLLPNESCLLEECKLFVALYQLNDGEHEKAIKLLHSLNSPQALYHLSVTYKKMALGEKSYRDDNLNSDADSKMISLLSKALKYGYEALNALKDPENKFNHLLHTETETLLREIKRLIKTNNSVMGTNEKPDQSSSDEYISLNDIEDITPKNQSLYLKNFSSTPRRSSHVSNYRISLESQIIDNETDQKLPARTETQLSNQKRNTTMSDYMELTKSMFDEIMGESRTLGTQIINTMNMNMKDTVDKFAQLKISVDTLKEQLNECQNECKDVEELKKQLAELRREISNLKKPSSKQAIVDNELFNLDEEYRTNDNGSACASQLPFAAQQVMPPFNQRLMPPFLPVPPNPFQLYGQNWFNLYNQYSQFPQPPTVPGATPIFDPARSQVNYSGVFPTTDQMYLDIANLVQQPLPTTPAVPVIPAQASVSAQMVAASIPVVSKPLSTASSTTTTSRNSEAKDIPRTLSANLVITSSDPLPSCATAPASILSATMPSEHIKGIPHNYQIQMPETEPAPSFGFPTLNNKINTGSAASNWNQNTVFKNVFSPTNAKAIDKISFSPNLGNTNVNSEVSDGMANDNNNKSRTLSEKSNTSVDNYDPCPDFKPIIPLPAEVVLTTGEEEEIVIFSDRAKLYRYVDKQWKERGIGDMKLLKHKGSGKVRVLMRREQIHKICANHHITSDMEIIPMKNEPKAYIWVANDFADETLVLEKLCIRFKTAEIARRFYETFEKSRQETTLVNKDSQEPETSTTSTADIKNLDTIKTTDSPKSTSNDLQSAKPTLGGFIFVNKPILKPVDDSKSLDKPIEVTPVKANVFSSLNFKIDSSSLLKKLPTVSNPQMDNLSQVKADMPNQSSTSDSVEEYEPTTEFKPVVPLPALVDTKTGEENENVLFEHRAKLFRFVLKEWKERGLGNIKLLVDKENIQKLRLLMRREQVMKVCCNHAITKTMIFQKMTNSDKAVTWCAQDFSEGELTLETFCLRFKTVQACNDFIEAVKNAQSKLKDESKAAKEEQNSAKQNYQIGDKNSISNPIVSNWGDKFKPKEGSWECKGCFVRNEASVENCSACNQSKYPNIKDTKPSTVKNEIKFSFGIPPRVSTKKEPSNSDMPILSGWGDEFQPKQGTWECRACFVRNNANAEICVACNSSRDPDGPKPETKGTLNINSESKFKFGIPNQSTEKTMPAVAIPTRGDIFNKAAIAVTKPTATVWSGSFNFGITPSSDQQKPEKSSIFDGTGVHKFNFGMPSDVQKQSSNMFSNENNSPHVKLGNGALINNGIQREVSKPALLPTPQKPSPAATFDFVFTPKAQIKAKSPIKSPKSEKGDESEGNEYASEDEGHHIQIAPIIPMPDKVKVITGEEDEDEIFGHRAKLFLFDSGEWKERGIGVVKILRHKQTAKLRVVMRREQVHKICLNHALTKDIIYNLKDDRNWIFAANDFSEGELSLLKFCLKFKSKEVALQFKDAIDLARDGKKINSQSKQNVNEKDSDVEFITEIQSNAEEKKKAIELMLPENFYLYKNKDPCPGCRGCKDDQSTLVDSNINIAPNLFQKPFSTPFKIPVTPANDSVYFTPKEFATPKLIGSDGSSPQSENEVHPTKDVSQSKKNSMQQPNPFWIDKQSPTIKPFSAPICINFSSASQTTTKSDIQSADPKCIFATANSAKNSIFFGSQPKEKSDTAPIIFGTGLNSKISTDEKTDVKTVFGGDAALKSKISSSAQGSLFDTGPLINSSKSIQGSIFNTRSPISSLNSSQSPSISNYFGTEKSILSFNSNSDIKSPAYTDTKTKIDLAAKEPILGSGDVLTFEAYSNQQEFNIKKDPNFKWEGAGQQLFAQQKAKQGDDGDKEGDAGNAGDEDYDPHYEPIVPLPDKIVVTTGEEDEEKLFGKRCKLYRYNEESREWKERGVGELKLLFHPVKKTYRLLFRREQVHKAVLNMLLFPDFELLPMSKTDRAWTWPGLNYAESAAGEQETLSVRFKTLEMATEFKDCVTNCVRKLQAAAAQAIREEEEAEVKTKSIAHLRLPKHLEDSARADGEMAMNSCAYKTAALTAAYTEESAGAGLGFALEPQEASDQDAQNYEQAYYQSDDYDQYYEEEEEVGAYFSCDCEATVAAEGEETSCAQAHVQLLLDGAPRVQLSDANTGELLVDMLLDQHTDFQVSERSCTWSGTDFSGDYNGDSTVTVTFPDTDTAVQFYDSCETTKGQNLSPDSES